MPLNVDIISREVIEYIIRTAVVMNEPNHLLKNILSIKDIIKHIHIDESYCQCIRCNFPY